jgi:integrase
LRHLKRRHPELWKAELDRAMEAAVVVVRRQAGTEAVLKDPEKYLRQAVECARWMRQKGETLFPPSDETTLRTFFDSYYRPNRLSDASPWTIRSYEGTLRYWMLISGDPPLKQITVATLSHFRDSLKGLRGKSPATRMAANTIRSHLRQLQIILDKAGPAGPRNRDAADLVARTPWVKPPREEIKIPRIVTMHELGGVYLAAVGMETPDLGGIKPAAWWRALLVITYNTGLRRRTLFALEMQHVDWKGHRLVVPPKLLKNARGQSIHLNTVSMRHVLKIRTDRELLFPWPQSLGSFNRAFHRLQDLAAIPRDQHFGLHGLRRTLATTLWGQSPEAAQLQLGHGAMSTTQKHYVLGDEILARALDALPQPDAFRESA